MLTLATQVAGVSFPTQTEILSGCGSVLIQRGTESSNPPPSSRESATNLDLGGRGLRIHSPPPERCYGAGGEDGNFVAYINRWSGTMPQPNDLSRSLVALDQDSTIIAVVEMSQSSWLVGGILPGI